MAKPSRIVDETVALRDELRQWKLALGWWSGLPAQEAFDFWDRQEKARLAKYKPKAVTSEGDRP